MPLDLSGFVTPEQNFGGLYKVAEKLDDQNANAERLAQQKESRQTATAKFLTDYLDPKDHLTGTAYDPQIVSGLSNILQQGQQLAAKGVNTNDILMALGPQVARLNQYSVTAKTINQRIKDQVARLKPYSGYNLEALQSQALKNAFYGPDGKLKDISSVDPNADYITDTVKNNPDLVTTSKGLDDFVQKTPMHEGSNTVTTAYGGRSKNVKYEARAPFWEDLQRDEKGNILTNEVGEPVGLGVRGTAINDDKGNPIKDESGNPFYAADKNVYNAVMMHNPDVADYIRGQVMQHFKQAGAKQMPPEGSPQWDMMARHILYDELKTRSKSYFKTINQEKETAPAIKVELGQDKNAMNALANYESAVKLKGDYAYMNPKTGKAGKTNAVQAIGKIFNNDPDFLQGESEDINGRNVIDVTQFLPGGGLKSGRGADEVYKNVWYDPNKRSLLVSTEGKKKDATGNKPTSIEEVPESQAGRFMARIAAANGIDPDKVSGLLTEMGYKNAKFTNVAAAGDAENRIQSEHLQKIDDALKDGKWDSLKGIGVKDGEVASVEERTGSSWLPGRDRYAVYVKTADGIKKAFTTSDKKALEDYLKNGQKSASQEDLRKKYDY